MGNLHADRAYKQLCLVKQVQHQRRARLHDRGPPSDKPTSTPVGWVSRKLEGQSVMSWSFILSKSLHHRIDKDANEGVSLSGAAVCTFVDTAVSENMHPHSKGGASSK